MLTEEKNNYSRLKEDQCKLEKTQPNCYSQELRLKWD